MKKILLILLILLCLCSCDKEENKEVDSNESYNKMIELIKKQDTFVSSSSYYEVSADLTKIENGYRFYVVVDKPKVAMYDVEAIAIEKDIDYTNKMAASIGVFETEQYNLIPNQANADKGYVKGVVISGTSESSEVTLDILVSWKTQDLSITKSEYLELSVKFNEDYVDQGALNG